MGSSQDGQRGDDIRPGCSHQVLRELDPAGLAGLRVVQDAAVNIDTDLMQAQAVVDDLRLIRCRRPGGGLHLMDPALAVYEVEPCRA
jgi:hypothetical protein